jgi:hypothetical protein
MTCFKHAQFSAVLFFSLLTCHVFKLEAHFVSIAIHIPWMAASRVSSDDVPIAPRTAAEFAKNVSCYRKVCYILVVNFSNFTDCMNRYLNLPQLKVQPKKPQVPKE